MKLYIGVIIILSSSVLFNAQKLFLKNFEIVHYGATYKKHTILIDYYAKLEEDGNLLVCFKSFKNPGYYKYKLTNEEIKVLNSLKNKKITKYVEDTFRIDYADSFYLSYKFGNYSQKFTYGRDFMSKDFYNIMNIILNKIDTKNELNKTEKFEVNFERLQNEIILQEKTDEQLYDQLPKKERYYLPPTT